MKKVSILLLIAIFAVFTACESAKKKTQDKIKDGEGKMYWPDGSVKGRGPFKNYKKEGKWTLFHKASGERLGEGGYKNDQQEGKWVFYHKNNKKSADGNFQGNQKVGEWIRYYDTGEDFAKETYAITTITIAGFTQRIGGIEGNRQTFYKSGRVKSEEAYRKGLKNGISREFYEDGKPKEFSEYRDNKYNGKVNKYYPNGRSSEQSYYVDGKRNGSLKTFHVNGTPYISGQFTNGMMSGKWTFSSSDRRIMKEGSYAIKSFGSGAKAKKMSKEAGLWKFYEYNGMRRMIGMELSLNGGMVSGLCKLYENGKNTGQGALVGIPKAKFEIYKNGSKAGTLEAAEPPPDNPNAKISHKWTGKWRVPKKNGKWTEFYPGSKSKKFEATYMMNKMNGKYKEYYNNGKPKAEGEYMNNKMNGTWKYYNADGSVDSSKSGNYMLGKKSRF